MKGGESESVFERGGEKGCVSECEITRETRLESEVCVCECVCVCWCVCECECVCWCFFVCVL